ncbi:LysE/ArgO family amino acid transporter, partial [Vibrio sp. 10N.222.54.F6]
THALEGVGDTKESLIKAMAMCLAFTWLNPHVYLDTVVLLGSISTQYQPNHMLFGAGAITGSFVFFFSLGYGARFLAPLFKNPRAWKVLEFVIGMIMASIAVSLVI